MWSRPALVSIRIARQLLLYLWASPGTVAGLGLCLLAVLSGGRVRRVGRILECYGGAVTRILGCGKLPCIGSARGMTLGHVVAGTDDKTLRMIREHELVHVRQYERWGPAFIPAYLGSSLWIGWRGGDPYLDNPSKKKLMLSAMGDCFEMCSSCGWLSNFCGKALNHANLSAGFPANAAIVLSASGRGRFVADR